MDENTPDLTLFVGLLERAAGIKKTLDSVKPLYDELDAITLRIATEFPMAQEIELNSGDIVKLVDNFAATNTVFRPLGIKRFELKIMTAEEYAYSRMSKAEKTAYTKAKNKAEEK